MRAAVETAEMDDVLALIALLPMPWTLLVYVPVLIVLLAVAVPRSLAGDTDEEVMVALAAVLWRAEPRTMALILSDVDVAVSGVLAVAVAVLLIAACLDLDEGGPVSLAPTSFGLLLIAAASLDPEGLDLGLGLGLDFFAPPVAAAAPKNEPRVRWLGESSLPPFLDRPPFFLLTAFLPPLSSSSSPSFLGVTVLASVDVASVDVEVDVLADADGLGLLTAAAAADDCCGGAEDPASAGATTASAAPAGTAGAATGASSSTLTS